MTDAGGPRPRQIAYKDRRNQSYYLQENCALEQIPYDNGSFVPHSEAKVSVFDHGILIQDDSICRGIYTGELGVPACVLADGDPPGRYYCGILCGPDPSTAVDDGPCPAGLSCLLSIDRVMDPGRELCSD